MEYFVNDISRLEEEVRKEHGFDYDIEEITCADLTEFFDNIEPTLYYEVFKTDEFELIETLRSASTNTLQYTDVFCRLTVEDVRFLLFDFVDICILIVDKKQKEELNVIINSLV